MLRTTRQNRRRGGRELSRRVARGTRKTNSFAGGRGRMRRPEDRWRPLERTASKRRLSRRCVGW